MAPLPLWTPLAILGLGAFGVYLVARSISRSNALLASITFGVLIASLLVSLTLARCMLAGASLSWTPQGAGHAMLAGDPGGFLIAGITQFLCALVALYSGRYLALDQRYEDYYPLLLGLSASVYGMVMAADLFDLYVFTGLAGIIAYILVAFRRNTSTSVEAGFKYAVMGGMATTLMLAGIGYILHSGATLSLNAPMAGGRIWSLGIALILGGLGIKTAMVPGHTWLPDAHSRAPSSISALLSGILVEAHLYVFIKAGLSLGWPSKVMGVALIAIAVLNMLVGNAMALLQIYGKRMLGYSTIAQVGYMLLAFGAGLLYDSVGLLTAAFYMLVAHAVLKSLAFLCKGICHFYHDATRIDELDGLFSSLPLTSLCFAVALAGLAGLPPLAGFVGKWELLAAMPPWDILMGILAGLFIVNSLLALGYYLPPAYGLFKPAPKTDVTPVSRWMSAPIVLLLVLAVGLGVFPGHLLTFSEHAARAVLSMGS